MALAIRSHFHLYVLCVYYAKCIFFSANVCRDECFPESSASTPESIYFAEEKNIHFISHTLSRADGIALHTPEFNKDKYLCSMNNVHQAG